MSAISARMLVLCRYNFCRRCMYQDCFHMLMKVLYPSDNLYILLNANFFCVCVCIIKLLCHFLPDLAQILNKAMNSKGAASKPVPGADFIQLLILRHLFVSHTQILYPSRTHDFVYAQPRRTHNFVYAQPVLLYVDSAHKSHFSSTFQEADCFSP